MVAVVSCWLVVEVAVVAEVLPEVVAAMAVGAGGVVVVGRAAVVGSERRGGAGSIF